MVSKVSALKLKLSSLSLLSLTLLLLVIHTRWLNQQRQGLVPLPRHVIKRSEPFHFLSEEYEGKEINVGLVNMDEEEEPNQSLKRHALGRARTVRFDRVSRAIRWKDFFPEWINEGGGVEIPKCPTIPMPRFEDYGEIDAVVARVPCGGEESKRGIRDVFRLQVHLVVANLVVRNGRRSNRTVAAVFVGSCGPMWEIFRCEDLVKHEGDVWIYKPDLWRLEQKLLMPVGSCQLALPPVKHGQGKIDYDASKVLQAKDPWYHPREAYATVLHSSEAYVCGAIALAQSIIQTNSTKDLVLLADKSITTKSRRALKLAGWKIRSIERIRSPNAEKHAYNEWNYSKLRLWQLKGYDKLMFIDSDLIVVKNLDPFFALPQLSAVGNDGVLFNSGLMLVEPSQCAFEMLMKKRQQIVSYNGGDQGYLNEMFTWWHRLPTSLNWLKVFEEDRVRKVAELKDAFAIHYLGYKPWMCYRDYDCNWDEFRRRVFACDEAHRRWWDVYDKMPKRLHPFCSLWPRMESNLRKNKAMAANASLADGHWRIKVKDPRKHYS